MAGLWGARAAPAAPEQPTAGDAPGPAAELAGLPHIPAAALLRELERCCVPLAKDHRDVIILRAPDFSRIFYVSPSYESIWGRTRASLHAEPTQWLAAVHPRDRRRVAAQARRLPGRGHVTLLYRIRRPDRAERTIESHLTAIPATATAPEHILVVARDVTSRHSLARGIARRRDRDAAMLELARSALTGAPSEALGSDALRRLIALVGADGGELVHRRDGALRRVPALAAQGHGGPDGSRAEGLFALALTCARPLTVEDVGCDRRAAWPEDLRAAGARSLLAAPLPGRPPGEEAVALLWSRRVGHFSAAVTPFCQSFLALLGLALESHASTAALAQSEGVLHQLAQHLEEALYVVTLDMRRLLYVSPGYARIWQRTGESLYADPRGWMQAILAEERPRVERALAAMVRDGGGFDCTYHIARPGGEVRLVRDRAFVVPGPDGQPQRMVGIAQDVTEQQAAAEGRLRLGLAQARIDAQDQALASVAHDLRSPLAALRLQIQRLAGARAPARAADRVPRMLACVDRMDAMLEDLLDASRAATLCREPLELHGLHAAYVAATFVSESEGGRLVLRPWPAALWVMGDRQRLGRALVNLVGNALKFSPAGTPVEVALTRRGTSAIVTVSDRGPGFSAPALAHACERFWQQDPAAGGGFGLGLPTAQAVAAAHGGRLELGNLTGGRGGQVRVILPLHGETPDGAAPRDAAPDVPPRLPG